MKGLTQGYCDGKRRGRRGKMKRGREEGVEVGEDVDFSFLVNWEKKGREAFEHNLHSLS